MLSFNDFLVESKDDASRIGGVSNNTKGVLHELLVGYHLQGGKHMDKHSLINNKTGSKESPQEAHDRLKALIHPGDYDHIDSNAKSAAQHILNHIATVHPGHLISHVIHTSKPGDTEKVTGVPASQKEDSSDIYITTKHNKTNTVMKHGISLKVSDNSSKNIPASSLGMNSSGHMANELFKLHQSEIKAMHPSLVGLSNADKRKDWARANPDLHDTIKRQNLKLLHSVAQHHAAELQHYLDTGNHSHVVNHIRDVLAAKSTPAELSGKATFLKHTTYQNKSGVQHHISSPGKEYEHIFSDPKNISVKSSGSQVHFYYNGKKFGSQAHKFDSQSDPLSSLKSAGRAV